MNVHVMNVKKKQSLSENLVGMPANRIKKMHPQKLVRIKLELRAENRNPALLRQKQIMAGEFVSTSLELDANNSISSAHTSSNHKSRDSLEFISPLILLLKYNCVYALLKFRMNISSTSSWISGLRKQQFQ